jgi:hypothetical protein
VTSHPVTGSSPSRRGRRLVAALGAVAIALLCVLVAPSGAPRAAADTQGGDQVQVTLTSLSPQVPQPGGMLHLSGTMRNTGGTTIDQVEIELQISQVDYRSGMAASQMLAHGHHVLTNPQQDITQAVSLGPNATASWTLNVPTADIFNTAYGSTNPGAYELDVEAWDPIVSEDLGHLWTYLPWEANQPQGASDGKQSVGVAMVWPLTARPKLDGHNQDQSSLAPPEFVDDQLAAELAPNGALGRLLADGKGLPVSWALDPDLLTSVYAMQAGYDTRSANGSPQPAPASGTRVATNWLAALRTTVRADHLWALPYADPDLSALAAAPPDLAGTVITTANDLGVRQIESELDIAPRGVLGWPVAGVADQPTLRTAKQLHATALLLSGSSLPAQNQQSLTYTPTGHTTIGGTPTAVSDPELDAVLAGDPADNGNGPGTTPGLLAAQRYLAELALINGENSLPRTIAVQAPRGFVPSRPLLAAMHAAAAPNTGWVSYKSLTDLLAAHPDPVARYGQPRPPAGATTGLPADGVRTAEQLNAALNEFTAILTLPDRITKPYDPVLVRTMSASWVNAPEAMQSFVGAALRDVNQLRGLVYMIQKPEITLSAKSGLVPITVVNDLRQAVRVRVTAVSAVPDQLHVKPDRLVTIPASDQPIVQISVSASVSGAVVPVRVQLLTPAGQPYGAYQVVKVRITNLGVITLVILFGSAALVVLAVLLRVYRSTRRHGHAEARGIDDGDGGPGSGGQDGPAGPGDTGPEGPRGPGGPGGRGGGPETPHGAAGTFGYGGNSGARDAPRHGAPAPSWPPAVHNDLGGT